MTTSDAGTLVAITHVPSPNMQRGERTFVDEVMVDYELALRQHAAYRSALQHCGAEVVVLDVNRTMPDCVFVEDTAIRTGGDRAGVATVPRNHPCEASGDHRRR
jgi:dimethylargininase